MLPLLPELVLSALVHQADVKERGQHEGEQGHGGASHQVEDGAKVGPRLADEEQKGHHEGSVQAALPVEI